MLAIRFARIGKRNKAQFKIVLQEKTAAPRGRHVDILGSYNPHSKEAILKEERVKYWISQGAQASDTVYNLLISKKIISGKKRPVKIPAKKQKKNTTSAEEVKEKKEKETEKETGKQEETTKQEKKKEIPKEKIVEKVKESKKEETEK
ncbi:MAG TPA: 30S ribosomal protein S16 [Candidatus Moranbacteria bacterium]|nr:30S ribosomal protein S16 [Candidatus Moranbacteria bacterium]